MLLYTYKAVFTTRWDVFLLKVRKYFERCDICTKHEPLRRKMPRRNRVSFEKKFNQFQRRFYEIGGRLARGLFGNNKFILSGIFKTWSV